MPTIEAFFDSRTWTLTYVAFDEETKDAVIIDPVLDYNPNSSKTWTESVDEVVKFVKEKDLNVHYILETHAHADHLSGAPLLKQYFPKARVAIGEHITDVQQMFKGVFDLPEDFPTDGSQFDKLLTDGEVINAGSFNIETLYTPGHTPACVTYKIDNNIFTGDALFMPDQGAGRCDFPGGSATDIYHSIKDKIYSLPDDTNVYVGHDYQPGGREVKWVAPLVEHKECNVALPMSRSEEDFVAWREARDASLDAPKLLFQSVQININAGALPEPHENQIRYLRIPINVFRPEPKAEADIQLEEV